MSPNNINGKRDTIYGFIEKKQLKSAIAAVKVLISSMNNWIISDKLNELETNYKYMLHYLVEGKGDPQQDRIYDKLFRDIYIITDDAAESLLLQNSSSIFFEKMRVQNVRETLSLDDYIDQLNRQADTLSFIDLLEEGEDKESRVRKNLLDHENILRDLFYFIFTSPRANNDFIESLKKLIDNELIPVNDKCVVISALTLNIFERFDAAKIIFLLDVCLRPLNEITTRAIIAIIPIIQIYRNRCQLYPELSSRLKLLSDNIQFNRMFMKALTGFIQAHETEKITKRLNEEIIPEMMKLSPMIGKKIKLDEWMGESGLDEKNPEWQKILDESGLSDKIQEFSELQMEGADVFHSTFSNLKNYPFFNELSNWFLPFDPNHSSVKNLFSGGLESSNMIKSMFETSIICNSDKYSFCFSIMMMPEEYRSMMVSQLGADGDELKKMQEDEFSINPNQKEDSIIKQYIQDLYRFFKLHPRSSNFKDIFNLPLNFHQIEEFYPIVLQPTNLEKIALYYFEKNNLKEASEAYKLLSESVPPRSEFWQKMGYCKQMMSDIKGALDDYLHAELIEDNNTWLLNKISHCYRILKKPETALEYYRRVEQLRPDDLNVQLNIGHCYLELKQYDEALNYYFKVELINSNNTRAWRSIAWCAFLSSKFDVAQSYYTRILDNKPNAHDYLNAGHVELCLCNNHKAVEYYKLSQNMAGSIKQFNSMLEDDSKVLEEAGVNTKILPIIVDKMLYDLE